MIKIKGGPKDINQLAKLVADIATKQVEVPKTIKSKKPKKGKK